MNSKKAKAVRQIMRKQYGIDPKASGYFVKNGTIGLVPAAGRAVYQAAKQDLDAAPQKASGKIRLYRDL